MLIDTHVHLSDQAFDPDRDEVIGRARNKDVKIFIDIAEDLESSKKTLKNALDHSFIYASVGVHPHHADRIQGAEMKTLELLLGEDRIVAVGETGLDYYYEHAPRKIQIEKFHWMCALALKHNLPVIVHAREAEEDILSVLREYKKIRGIIHCFTGTQEFCDEALNLGFFISFSGIITFKKADDLREIVRRMPEDRLLVETDAPFLSPVPFRGKRNEPVHIIETAKMIAQLKNMAFDKACDMLYRNSIKLFQLSEES